MHRDASGRMGLGRRLGMRAMRRWKVVGLTVAAVIVLGAGWLWLSMLSPWGYTPPAGLPAIEAGGPHRVFVYGTLRNPAIRWVVIGRHVPTASAVLEKYRKEGLDLRAQADARVEGEVFVVDADELRRLDRYERLGVRYERVELELADRTPAWVYRRLQAR